ncbi:hypothetical protein CULT_1330002 [[Clostridium] ultunense Esp]|nr:hypothetical protein CULT_1330002 [[Clostridium] ultunense Esp]
MRKLLGLFILSISLIGLALMLQLAQITQKLDELTSTYNVSWGKYLNPSFYLVLIVNIAIALKLIYHKKK